MSIPKEIEGMEQIADELEKWAKDKENQSNPPSEEFQNAVYFPFQKAYEWLLYHKPDLAKDIRKDYDTVKQYIIANEEQRKGILYGILAPFSAAELARKLRHIVQIARAELMQEKPSKTGQGNKGQVKTDEQKEKRSLSDIANSVRHLLISQQNKNRFREQLQRFYKEYKAWDKGNDEYNRKSQERKGEDEKAREKRIGKLKEPRPCPLDLLDLSDTYKDRHLLDMTKLVCSEGPELSAKESKILEACYVLLAIIYDNVFEYFKHNPRNTPISDGIWPKDEMWVETKWKEIKDNAYQPALQDEMNYIVELVETDLDKLSVETEGKSGTSGSSQDSKSNILGMSWDEAKNKAEEYVDDHGFTNVSHLARTIGCSKGTLYKAIEGSEKLQGARRQSKKKTSPPTKGLSEEIISTQELVASSPDEEADVKLLRDGKPRTDLIDGILNYTRIINRAERKKNADYKCQNEEELKLQLEECTDELLARLYISRQENANDIHADDSNKPGHRRQA